MIPPRLVQYAKQQLDLGQDPGQLRSDLLKAGWSSLVVAQVFFELKGQKPSTILTSRVRKPYLKKLSADSSELNGPFPSSLKGWNWGAFAWQFIWGVNHNIWLGLVILVPVLGWLAILPMAIVFGLRGNAWAWKSRKFDSLYQFKEVQATWAKWGFWLLGVEALLCILAVLTLQFYLKDAEFIRDARNYTGIFNGSAAQPVTLAPTAEPVVSSWKSGSRYLDENNGFAFTVPITMREAQQISVQKIPSLQTCLVVHMDWDWGACLPGSVPKISQGNYLFEIQVYSSGYLKGYAKGSGVTIGGKSGYLHPDTKLYTDGANMDGAFRYQVAYLNLGNKDYVFKLLANNQNSDSQWQEEKAAFLQFLESLAW